MSAAIGKAALVLSTNYAGLSAGLKGARAEAVKGAGDIESGVSSRLGGIGSKLGGLMKVGAIAGVAGVGAAIAGSVGLATAALDDLQEIRKQASTAKAFGIDPSEFSGLAGVAKESGSDLRDFTESLVTMAGLGKNAAAGTEEAAKAFRVLGLDAQQFNQLPTVERYYAMMDALAGVKDETDRLKAAAAAFGEDGMKNVIPLIGKTSAEIKQMAGNYRLSNEQIDSATRAAEAQKKAGMALGGLWRSIVVAVAPAVEVAAGVVTKLQPFFGWLGRAAATYYGLVAAVLTEVVAGVESLIGWFGELLGSAAGLTGPWPTVEQVITGAFRLIGKAGAYTWDALKAGAGAVVFGVSYLVDAFAGLVGVFKDLVELAKELPDKVRPGWLDNFVAGTERFRKRVDGVGERMRGWGKDQVMGFGSSAARVDAWFDRLKNKKKEVEQIAPKVDAKATQEAVKAATKIAANTALTFGSADELTARIRAEVGGKSEAEKQLAEQKKANEHLGNIADGVRGMKEKIDFQFDVL